jgi:phosphoribosylformylglycinamidine cyclo-ligase
VANDAGSQQGLTYRDAGVDIDKANEAKKKIKELARSTFNRNVLSEIGSFAGQYRLDPASYDKPVLVSSADGVGTKLKIAFLTGIHNTVGIDIVSHCTNDILVQGALPMFFLDYIATGTLEPQVVAQIVEGLAEGCKQSECVLLGGETAEMPDFYGTGEYDLAGFIVGIADEGKLFNPILVSEGDRLIGLPSSGLHTNGYSLVRKLVFEQEQMQVSTYVDELGKSIGEELLVPHRNYLKTVKNLIATRKLSGIAHITGGGITENLDRVLPSGLDASVELGTWKTLPIFHFIQERGRVSNEEMLRTFNMGVGLILVIPEKHVEEVEESFRSRSEEFFHLGSVTKGTGKVTYK